MGERMKPRDDDRAGECERTEGLNERADARIGRVGGGTERPRARDLGLTLGELQPGPHNAITDVQGVLVGHCTINEGEGSLVPGEGPVRTGVTAIVPHGGNMFNDKVPAAVYVINGFGKAVGFVQVAECGVLETPILLTNTLNVGRVADALVEYMLQDNPAIGVSTGTVNPVVAECNDGYLNDIRGRHVGREHVFAALRDAKGGPVAEGAVGAGTGMTAFGWKGGVGTSSRLVPIAGKPQRSDPELGQSEAEQPDYVLGTLVLSNFGAARDLIVGGWPVGRFLPDPHALSPRPDFGAGDSTRSDASDRSVGSNGSHRSDGARIEPGQEVGSDEGDGSVVIVIATDAPLDARQLRRIAVRAAVGIVRCGSRLSHGSGDYVIAFSTAGRIPHTHATGSAVPNGTSSDRSITTHAWPDDSPVIAGLLRAAGESTEEAVLNCMLQAGTTVGRDGHVRHALPVEQLRQLIHRFKSDVGD